MDIDSPKKIDHRLKTHPIIPIEERNRVDFTFNGEKMCGVDGEPVTSALYANGVRVFCHNPPVDPDRHDQFTVSTKTDDDDV